MLLTFPFLRVATLPNSQWQASNHNATKNYDQTLFKLLRTSGNDREGNTFASNLLRKGSTFAVLAFAQQFLSV